jgi:hypothetical protein
VTAVLGRDGGRRFGRSPAEEIVLFQSELRAAGARHTALARLPFGGPAASRA